MGHVCFTGSLTLFTFNSFKVGSSSQPAHPHKRPPAARKLHGRWSTTTSTLLPHLLALACHSLLDFLWPTAPVQCDKWLSSNPLVKKNWDLDPTHHQMICWWSCMRWSASFSSSQSFFGVISVTNGEQAPAHILKEMWANSGEILDTPVKRFFGRNIDCFWSMCSVFLADLRWAEASWRQIMWHQSNIGVLQWIWLTCDSNQLFSHHFTSRSTKIFCSWAHRAKLSWRQSRQSST